MRIQKNTISFRINSRVLLVTLTLFLFILTFYYYYSRDVIRNSARDYAIQLAENIEGKIENRLQYLEQIPEMISLMMEKDVMDKDSLSNFLLTVLQENDEVCGSAIAFEPNFYPEKGLYFSPYAYRNPDGIHTMLLGGKDYEYFYMDWYQIPKMLQEPYWSEPYFDEGGGGFLMATYSVPFYKNTEEGRTFAGVATIDIALYHLTDMVSNIKVFETGYAFMLSRNGWVLAHPDSTQIMNESIFSTSEAWSDPLLREIGRDLQKGNSRFRDYNLRNKNKRWIYYTPLKSGQYSIAVVYPDVEIFASLNRMTVIMILQILVGIILLVFLTIKIVNKIASPLVLFAQASKDIAGGNFNVKLPEIKTEDEMLELHNAFTYMQKKLHEYVDNLIKTTAAKENIESQLRIASEIQMSMIPKDNSVQSENNRFYISGFMNPAKEVGGDLFNYFMIDEDHLGFTIGDVAGKGVPAALFMSMTNILIKTIAMSGLSPAEVLFKVNNGLCHDNIQCMFVTLFFGKLNIRTGEIQYANGGHNPFILIGSDGIPKYQKLETGIVLAAFEDFAFVNETLTLNAGDTIFMYTDGVTEAMNWEQKLFGEERLLKVISEYSSENIKEIISK
ncbi:MAG: SpoIIE family protein phosphatase, partial [Bacteroidales bacterium]|nr:SpoIIE family protein phosphatase [Bacteroidales bacterium]